MERNEPTALTSSLVPPRVRPRWRALLPVEHGGWSLVCEPVVLGLIAAPGAAGAALAVAVVTAFLARRPLSLARSSSASRVLAQRAFATCALVVVVALGVTAMVGPWKAMAALSLAAPPALLFLFLDAQREARAEAAEISGVLAFAVVPLVLALLAGWTWPLAAALGFTAVSRSVPVVLAVRAYLRSSRGDSSGRRRAIVVTLALALASVALALWWQLPWIIAALAALQLVRVVWLLGPRPPKFAARKLGIFETISGAVHVVLAAVAWRMAL